MFRTRYTSISDRAGGRDQSREPCTESERARCGHQCIAARALGCERADGCAQSRRRVRLLVVGGAASLQVGPGRRLLDTPEFPEAFKAEATAGARFLEPLRSETALGWTFLSPFADFASGVRTGHIRLGDDHLLSGADGKGHISMEAFAIAMVDELEHPRHRRRRFTFGYQNRHGLGSAARGAPPAL
jgi:hypothetical protein